MSDQDQAHSAAMAVLDQQNSVAAVLAACVGAIVAAMLWKIAVALFPGDSTSFAVEAGVVVGLFVRLVGRGLTLRFRLIAVFFTLVATFLGLYLVHFRVSGIFFWLWLAAGAALAFHIAAVRLPVDIDREVWREITINKFREPGMAGSGTAIFAFSMLGSLACAVVIVILGELTGITNNVDKATASERLERGEQAFEHGWNVGRYFDSTDCRAFVRQHEESCDGDASCEAEAPFLLDGCLEASKRRAEFSD